MEDQNQEQQGFVEPYESRIARYRAVHKPRVVKQYPRQQPEKPAAKASQPKASPKAEPQKAD